MSEVEPMVLTDREVSADHLIMDGVDDSAKPLFSIGMVAMVFFNMSPHWVRWLDHKPIYFQGEELIARRRNGARIYTLSDVEKMAHGLAQAKRIKIERLRLILDAVLSIARTNNLL